MTRKRKIQAWWMVEAAMIILVTIIAVWGSVKVPEKTEVAECAFEDRGVARMNIELNEVSLEEVNEGDKEIKYGGNKLTMCDSETVKEYGNVEIKGRGNSTWWAEGKKPYQIKFKERVDLLGLGMAKKWVLLANSSDATAMRNDVALTLAEMLDEEYSHKGDFVELYVNGEYLGLYYLVQRVEIAKGSVDLKGEDGVLFEMDFMGREENCHEAHLGSCLALKDVVVDNPDKKQGVAEDFLVKFEEAEMAAEVGDYKEVEEILDIESFVKYFLVNEFTVNPDAYSSSFYLYRSNQGKIHAGPVWDFDLALGNKMWTYWVDERYFSPTESMVRRREAFGEDELDEDLAISKLVYYLAEMPEFQTEVRRVFQEKMTGRGEELVARMNMRVKEIEKAIESNSVKWGGEEFVSEFERLKQWVAARYEYFEEVYGESDGGWQENIRVL